jgi:hypothetical protein
MSFLILISTAFISAKLIVVPYTKAEINEFIKEEISPAVLESTEEFWFADGKGTASNGLARKSIVDINEYLSTHFVDSRLLNLNAIVIQSIGSVGLESTQKFSYTFTNELSYSEIPLVFTYGVLLSDDSDLMVYILPISVAISAVLSLLFFPVVRHRSESTSEEMVSNYSLQLDHDVDPIRGALVREITTLSGSSLESVYERCISLSEEELNIARQWSTEDLSSFREEINGPRWNNLSLAWIKVLVKSRESSYRDALPIAAEFSSDQLEQFIRYRNDDLAPETAIALLRQSENIEWTHSGIEWLKHLTGCLEIPTGLAVANLNSSKSLKIYIQEKRISIFGYEFDLPPQEFALYSMIADQTSRGIRLKAPTRIASQEFQSLFNKYYHSLSNARHNVTEKAWDDEATTKAIHQTTLKLRLALKLNADNKILEDFLLKKVQIGSDFAVMLPLSSARIEIIKTKQRQLPSEQPDTIKLAKSLSI